MSLKLVITFLLTIAVSVFSQWTRLNTSGTVPSLANASAVYVPEQNSMLVFGGRTAAGISNGLWKLNLTTDQWTQLIPVNTPPASRYTQNAYYDTLLKRMIIWSGQGTELYNDVWSYNIITNSWQQLWPDGNTPGVPLKRYGTGSVFDPLTRNIYTFAGFTTSGRFEDTWTFHTDSMSWHERTNLPHPPKRCLHSACLINDQRKMIIYAGQDTGPLDDIWSLDMNTFSWQNLTPQFKPPGRFFYSMVYTGSGNIVVFGGLDTAERSDMWKFSLSNNSWEQVSQNSPSPAARWGHTAVYIPSTDKMIIFGGTGASAFNDTWQYSNAGTIGISKTSARVPDYFLLEQNYPNPFNPVTVIKFAVPYSQPDVNSSVILSIYDITGRKINTLADGKFSPGTYSVEFNGSALSSGVYICLMTTGNFSASKKMILAK